MLGFNFESIISLIETFDTDLKCYQYLESIIWKNGPICPHCKNKEKFWRLGDNITLKCSACRKKFNVIIEETQPDTPTNNKDHHRLIRVISCRPTAKHGE